MLAALALAVGGCGDDGGGTANRRTPSPSASATAVPAPTTSSTPGPSATRPAATATTRLADFLAAVDAADARLAAVADLVNGDIDRTTIAFRSRTVRAVRELRVEQVARAIPPGLPPSLLGAALLVYSDLAGRAAAFNRVWESPEPLPRSGAEGKDVLRCLGQGGRLAQRFPADVAALRRLADSLPPFRVASARSDAGLEVAVRARAIYVGHHGCGACGGDVDDELAPMTSGDRAVWPGSDRTWTRFGTAHGIPFRARWASDDRGWEVQLNAC